MARTAKLKVYRTAIGFHDAYVAASSQKAALAAWGSDKDLFARGVAELVTDEALTAGPLAEPGKVVKRLRGTAEEQIAALPPEKPKRPRPAKADEPAPKPGRRRQSAAPAAKPVARKPAPPPAPKPSRTALDEAEGAVVAAEQRHAAELDDIRAREQALARELRDLQAHQQRELTALDAARKKAEQAYHTAIERWSAGL